MAEATTYSTYCEVQHQFPVEAVADFEVGGRGGFIQVSSRAKMHPNGALPVILKGFWKESRPRVDSILSGIFTLATTPHGPELCFERLEAEIRPGDEEADDYADQHFSQMPLQVRAFGPVTRLSEDSFTVSGQTFIINERKNFDITFKVKKEDTEAEIDLPELGSYAGGRGPVLSSLNGRLIVELVEMQSNVPKMSPTRRGKAQGKTSSKWTDAWQKANTAGEREKDSHTITDDNERPAAANNSDLAVRSSFCETFYRFIITSSNATPYGAIITGKTVTTQMEAHEFTMKWPLLELPKTGAIYAMFAKIILKEDVLVLSARPSDIELRPGTVEDGDYMEKQLLRQPWRIRAGGPVIASNSRTVTIEVTMETDGNIVTTLVTFLIPETKRWMKFKPVPVGQFISARGPVSTVDYGEMAKFMVDVEHLQSPPRGGNASPATATSTNGGYLQAWNGPTRSPSLRAAGKRKAPPLPETPCPPSQKRALHFHDSPASSSTGSSSNDRSDEPSPEA
ncbi:hypothetical protein OC834_003990 [Tilletia horrida]|nr:hypothetical protein OC834_003990 [Tilletia horrida]